MSVYSRPDSVRPQMRLSVPVNGSRVPLLRSVGTTDTVKAAAVASSLQALADGIPSGDWLRIRRHVEDVFLAAGHPVPVISRDVLPVLRLIGPFVEEYIARREKTKLSASHKKLMKRCLTEFAALHSTMELVHFKGFHVQAWLDGLLVSGITVGTVRNLLSVVSAMFAHAVKLGVLSVNPCAGVDVPDAMPAVLKLPMADEDFERLHRFLSGNPEKKDWLVLAMGMRHAGLRLVDASLLSGVQVSFVDGACLLDVTPGKTDKPEVIPIFEPLASFLRGLGDVRGPLAPSLAGLSPSCLSKRFSKLCDDAGIDPRLVTLPNGREHRRVSAHSLKHAFVTGLVRLGIPEALRMRMSKHVSEEAHRGYDHADGMDIHRQAAPYFSKL